MSNQNKGNKVAKGLPKSGKKDKTPGYLRTNPLARDGNSASAGK